jgi:hypothetical protein
LSACSYCIATHNGVKKNTIRIGIKKASAVGDIIDRLSCWSHRRTSSAFRPRSLAFRSTAGILVLTVTCNPERRPECCEDVIGTSGTASASLHSTFRLCPEGQYSTGRKGPQSSRGGRQNALIKTPILAARPSISHTPPSPQPHSHAFPPCCQHTWLWQGILPQAR